MDFLNTLGEWFEAATAAIERFITLLFGSSNRRRIRKFGFERDERTGKQRIFPGSLLDRINTQEAEWQKLSDEELKETATKLRARLAAGETLDDILPEAFAAVREAGRRFLKMRHYDVQLIGGYFLHKGMIAEMVTGEGKTLVATLPAFLNGLAAPVHVVTVNDYLARRDMEWMGPLYLNLGLTVGAIQANMDSDERKVAYDSDITYGTNNEFGFDYLRDNMKPAKEIQVQRPLGYAIVDEIDNILIDEARTPLIISGFAHDDTSKYPKADRIARQLTKGVHFEVKEKEHTCNLTDVGVREAEKLADVESFYTAGNMEWPHLIDNSLKAHHLYKRDVNYVVEQGQVIIVDEFTGRKMEGRQWSDGLHQAVEAKEGVQIKAETQTLATITLQNYFKLYKKLGGMTGTAMTEADEFWKIYKLDVVTIPTNRPLKRVNAPDVIFRSEPEKWNAVVEEIREVHGTGRPILVGTVSIEKSEMLSEKISKFGIKHNVLNAKYHEREAEIIAQAGRQAAVTIATNMAGRGTDIILGGNPEYMAWDQLRHHYGTRLDVPKAVWDDLTAKIAKDEGMIEEGRRVAEFGGLHVIGTERHEARRIDLQLRGRSGRQGDPGSSRFLLSLEDDLMRIFAGDWVKNMLTRLGMQEGEAIESRMVTRRIEAAQKKVEERHFDMRKHLLEYDEVMDEQRKQVYSYRQKILDGGNCRQLILQMIDKQIEQGVPHFLTSTYRWETIASWAAHEMGMEVEARTIDGMDQARLEDYFRDEAARQAENDIAEKIEEDLPETAEDQSEWNWLSLSKWVNVRFGLNTNDRELKKIGREELHADLTRRAIESMSRFDFSPLAVFCDEQFGLRSVCGWLHQQFTLEMRPEEFENLSPEDAVALIRRKIEELYRQKEVEFPVAVGMTKFMAEGPGGGGERYNREGLVRWANDRFQASLPVDEVKDRPRNEIENLLKESSRRFFVNGELLEKSNEYLEQAYDDRNGHLPQNGHVAPQSPSGRSEALNKLSHWAKEEFGLQINPQELEPLDYNAARERVLHAYDTRYRPELYQVERALILEVLDTAWKDHLYYMDHLRSGIGLVGYAQLDPKVEYKREGRKTFLTMWDRVAQQVTSSIFRIEKESPGFVGSLWEITAVSHAEAAPMTEETAGPDGQQGTGPTVTVVEPIHNRLPKVGRNDPCPCGSGKKYKKCCGANE
jgi:preprotein translocase subunit SecA